MTKSTNYFHLYSCIKIVHGFSKSILLDIHRQQYLAVEKKIATTLEKIDGLSFEEIRKSNLLAEADSILNHLIKQEIGFSSNLDKTFFPKIQDAFYYPHSITNIVWACLDFNMFDLETIFKKNTTLFTNYASFIFFKKTNEQELTKLLKLIETLLTDLISYSIYINEINIPTDSLKPIVIDHPRLCELVIFNSKNATDSPLELSPSKRIIFSKQELKNFKTCGIVNKLDFNKSLLHFTESLHHNSCLNRKIAVDIEGYIRNCPSMPKQYGNIKDTTLETALSHPDFKKYWNINKDQISVCKDCEFRHICTDCRAYIENPEDIYSKPLKCGYNPYTGEWTEWSTHPLKQKAIDYYEMREVL